MNNSLQERKRKRTSLILGNYLNDERWIREWSKAQLSRVTGITMASLSEYENDRIFPRKPESHLLAKAFDQDPDQFYALSMLNKTAKLLVEECGVTYEQIGDIMNIFGAIVKERLELKSLKKEYHGNTKKYQQRIGRTATTAKPEQSV